ncbi:MAG: S1 RNA-binding domain-containing protein [Anaerolineae bacterium]|nr:S1 RNA-binding domain-containing protein [Anaerolineae bacterium]
MSASIQRREHPSQPEPLEEGYWASLLEEGEFAEDGDVFHEEDWVSQDDQPAEVDSKPQTTIPTASQDDWEAMQRIMDADEVIELPVIGYNRGGLLVEWQSLRGFVPASQLIEFNGNAHPNVRRNSLTERIGHPLTLRVIELDAKQNRLILSERAARAQPGERADLLANLQPGNYVTGIITNLCDFGAFVDLGGLEGLIHISELSWGRVGHPADILDRGEVVETQVLEVHPELGRIALSLKRMHPDPWRDVHLRYRVGEVVEGTITNVVDFGAFARVEEGLEGLIHVSELAEGHFLHPRNVVSEGQQIRARILSIDGHARRLGLSLRALEQNGHAASSASDSILG